MNTYKISYDDRRGCAQSMDVLISAQGYVVDGDTLILLDKSPNGEFIHVASFRHWNSIIDISVVQE